ncbi:Cyclase-associated protein 1 [Chlorella vulgaris]
MLEAAVSRLEVIASRLEETEARLASVVPSGTKPLTAPASPPIAAPAATAPAEPPLPIAGDAAGALAAYRQLLSTQLAKVVDAAEGVGGHVQTATRILAEGFQREAAVVEAFGACKKPDAAELQHLVQPVGDRMVAAGDLAAGPRSPYQSHFKLISEAMQSLSWVAYSGPSCGIHLPAQHVEDALSAADFYANKVLMEWRGKDPGHVTWAFCAKHYPAGPQWNASGIPTSKFHAGAAAPPSAAATAAAANAAPASAAATAAKPAGPPPPPPPPPGNLVARNAAAAAAATAAAAGGGNPMAALFSELNKGDSVTSGLKKVTDDMKTKNRAERSGTVPAGPAAPAAAAAQPKAAAVAPKPPRLECEQGRKWVVENQMNNREVVIDDTQPKQTVRGKVNAITLDKCSRTGLLFDSVVATVELVNCAGVEVQCTGSVPTVAVDKCDGCQLYLPRGSLEGTDITTAKSSEVNVILPGATEDSDPVESAIPEQFVTRFRGGRWVTEPVAHSGA